MNITFMIGNGFDLNLNLKTSYKDFYEFYKKNTKDDLILSSIEDNYDLWADLELGLGLFLKDIDESQIDEFLDSKANLESLLEYYLIKESEKFTIADENKFCEEFRKKIINFSDGFCTEDKNQLKRLISYTTESINYCFITFNYTTLLDKMVELVNTKYDIFSKRIISSLTYRDLLCKPHHIHGTLDNEDLILCVDNLTQIDNEAFKADRRITDYMIKTNVNRALGERKTETAKEIIDKSRYICLFGLSIGDTDFTWWKYLVEWLKKYDSNRLVLFVRDNSTDNSTVRRSGTEKIRIRDQNRATFLEKGGCTNQEISDKIRDKIIIVSNSEIFTYKNISIREEQTNVQA